MANPVFSSSNVFGEPRRGRGRAGTVQAPAPGQMAQYGQTAQAGVDAATLDQMYSAPAATTRDTKRLTYDDVIVKTGGLLALTITAAVVGWNVGPARPSIILIAALVGLVLGFVNAFKREPSPALIMAYAAFQGVFLGGISYLFENMSISGQNAQPIVFQAVLGTFATFAAALALYKSGRVRVTPKFTRFLLIGMVGYLGFSLVNVVLSFFMPSSGFGPLREGGFGMIAGLVGVVLAAMSLIVDFDGIKRGVEQGVPAKYAWTAAFGLLVTLIWLYLEILRILAILRGDN